LAVSSEGNEQGLGLLGVEVESIGKVCGHGVSSFLAELTKPLDELLPLFWVQLLEGLNEIEHRK
jgi:hypothetical protein